MASVATVTMLSLWSGRGELALPSASRWASWAESGGCVRRSRAAAGPVTAPRPLARKWASYFRSIVFVWLGIGIDIGRMAGRAGVLLVLANAIIATYDDQPWMYASDALEPTAALGDAAHRLGGDGSPPHPPKADTEAHSTVAAEPRPTALHSCVLNDQHDRVRRHWRLDGRR